MSRLGLKQSYGGMGNGIGRTEAWQEVGESLTKKAALAPNGKQKLQNPFSKEYWRVGKPSGEGRGLHRDKTIQGMWDSLSHSFYYCLLKPSHICLGTEEKTQSLLSSKKDRNINKS